jgi:hypothetical protein
MGQWPLVAADGDVDEGERDRAGSQPACRREDQAGMDPSGQGGDQGRVHGRNSAAG